MLGKTLILGLISASAAGAIVYYGTAPQGSEALETYSNSGVQAEKSVKAQRVTIEPRLPTIRKADEEDGRQKLASAGWKTDNAEVKDMPPAGEADPKKQSRWLDQYLKKNDKQDRGDDSNGASASATNSYTVTEDSDVDAEAAAEDMPIEDNIAANDPRTFRIENGKLVEVKPDARAKDTPKLSDVINRDRGKKEQMPAISEPKPEHNFEHNMSDMANDSTPLISTVMREAGEIKKPELRDQAYFEITEYALSEGRYDSARMAHDMIEQEELSYTAKSRIAVAFAQNGQPSKAFKVIGEVDEAELRDFMRLQVIEALIAPQRLPEAWQEKRN